MKITIQRRLIIGGLLIVGLISGLFHIHLSKGLYMNEISRLTIEPTVKHKNRLPKKLQSHYEKKQIKADVSHKTSRKAETRKEPQITTKDLFVTATSDMSESRILSLENQTPTVFEAPEERNFTNREDIYSEPEFAIEEVYPTNANYFDLSENKNNEISKESFKEIDIPVRLEKEIVSQYAEITEETNSTSSACVHAAPIWIIDSPAWTEIIKEPIFSYLDTWFVREMVSGEIHIFYTEEEAYRKYSAFTNQGIACHWGTGEQEKKEVGVTERVVEHPETGHWE